MGRRRPQPKLVELAHYGSRDHRCRLCGRYIFRLVTTEPDGWRHIRYKHTTPPPVRHEPDPVPLLGYLD